MMTADEIVAKLPGRTIVAAREAGVDDPFDYRYGVVLTLDDGSVFAVTAYDPSVILTRPGEKSECA